MCNPKKRLHLKLRAWLVAAAGISLIITCNIARADSTTVVPGDGPQCRLVMPATISFNTTLTNSVTVPLVGICTRYPVKWEWTAPPLDYSTRNMAGDNILFAPLFASGIMSWTYDNRKVTDTNTISLTFTTTGTHVFAVRAKDADYIPPSGQPAGFWGPWGAPGAATIDTSGAWQTITLTCSPVDETRILGPGGVGLCTGGRVSTLIETRSFCADSVTPVFGPWIPAVTCACPSGTIWNGSACVAAPICTVSPTPAFSSPGQTITWNVSCNQVVTRVTWTTTTPPLPPVPPCTTGLTCTQTYPTPQTVCYAVSGTSVAGTGPVSAPACAVVACVLPSVWSAAANACGVPPTITSPTFTAGTPQPPSLPITVTGTTPICTANNLPPGWNMSAGCALTPTVVGIVQPPVPVGCTVTATNAWGRDSQPCLSNAFDTPTCSAVFLQWPVKLLQYTQWPTDEYTVKDTYSVPSREYPAGAKGSGSLQVTVDNGNTVESVNCTDSTSVAPSTTSTAGGSAGLFGYTVGYEERYDVPADDYVVGLEVSEFQWLDAAHTRGITLNSRHFIQPRQLASPAPSATVCTATVKNTASGKTATCQSPAISTINTASTKSCTLDVSLQRWIYNGADGNSRSENLADLSSGARSSGFARDFDSFKPPNTGYLTGRMTSPLQLGPTLLATNETNLNATDPLFCRRKVRTASNPSAPFSAPFAVTPARQVNFGPQPPVSSGGTSMDISSLGPVVASFGGAPIFGAPVTPVIETIDPGSTDYDIECTFAASGFNPQTGGRESVACGAYYSYRAGSACQFEGTAASGVTITTTEFSGGGSTTLFSAPNSAYNGVFRYLTDSATAKFVSEQSTFRSGLQQNYNGQEMLYLDNGTAGPRFAPIMAGNKDTVFDMALAPATSTSLLSPSIHGICDGFCTVGAIMKVKRVMFGDRISLGQCSVVAGGTQPSGTDVNGNPLVTPPCPTCIGTTTTTTTTITADGTVTSTSGSGSSTVGGCSSPPCARRP